jgi:hypothetical protein
MPTGHGAVGDRQEERGPVIAAFASPPGQAVGDHPQAALPRRTGIKRREPCFAPTAVLPGGVADKGVDIPGRRDTQRYDAIRQDALRRRKDGMPSLCAQRGFLAGWAWGVRLALLEGKVRIEDRAPPSWVGPGVPAALLEPVQ